MRTSPPRRPVTARFAATTGPMVACLLLTPAPAHPQNAPRFSPWAEIHAGSEIETYLRTLQTLGLAGAHPWSLRGFSPAELERIAPSDGTPHPWSGRFDLTPGAATLDGLLIAPLRITSVANTTFAYGVNDGAFWAGRGPTVGLQGGLRYATGPFTLSFQPVVFAASNAAFGEAEPLVYIDAPDRFGDDPYARVDAGESFARVDLSRLSAGLSTERMVWGPSERYPLVLGPNAPGFAHLFLGTGDPVGIGIGRLRFRFVWGRLEPSDLVPEGELSGARFASTVVGLFESAWPRGFEIGLARFYHLPWRSSGPTIADVLRPFEAFGKERVGVEDEVDPQDEENQVASVFLRWVFSEAGLELYGEFYREDHALDVRDFLLEPDHDLATNLGVRRVWQGGDGGISVLSIEALDAKINHLQPVRGQSLPYPHSPLLQGHTHRGQILGSPAAFGGEGLSVTLDRYDPAGRRTLRFERTLRRDAREPYVEDAVEPARDVAYALTAEALSFRGAWEVVGEVTGVWNLNRNLGGDRGNLRLAITAAWRPGER